MLDCDRIQEKLQAEDNYLLREFAFAAGEYNCRQAVPRLAELLCSENMGVQEAAELTLRKLGGKITVQTLIPLLESDDAGIRNAAMDVLRDIATHDLDSFVDLLQREDSDIRIFAADILGYTGSVMAVRPLCEALLKDSEPNVRYQAAISLGALEQQEAAKCLNLALRDEEWVQFAVVEALKKIRDESCISALLNSLGQGSDLVDVMIVEALGEMGNVKAVPLLLSRMDEASVPLRNKIVQALVKLLGRRTVSLLNQAEQERFLQYLLTAVQDEDTEVQNAAVRGLENIGGEQASRVVFELCLTIDPDQEPERFENIIQALQNIGYSYVLNSALQSGNEEVAERAVKVLTGIQDVRATHSLLQVFWKKDRDLQRAISRALCYNAGQEALDFFRDVLHNHQDAKVLKNAMHYLGVRMQDQASAEQLFSFLEHPFHDVQEVALEACSSLKSPMAGNKFQEMLKSSEPLYRAMAIYGLSQSKDSSYLQEVKQLLADQEPEVRRMALEAVAVLGDYQPDFLPDLVLALNDEHREVRLALLKVLAEMQSAEVEHYLLAALEDGDDWVKIRALEALVQKGFKHDVQHIVSLLQESSQMLKLKTIEALGQIGGEQAFQALLPMLGHEDKEILFTVETALNKIRQDQVVD